LYQGAGYINEWLLEKYGPDSMSILIDEGNGMAPVYGQMFAIPAVAEKGYLDAEVRIETPGGHSSVPPAHTGIGLMALAISELEKHPHALELGADSLLVDFVACAARYAPKAPNQLKKIIGKVISSRSKGKVDKKALGKVRNWWDSAGSVEAGFPPGLGRAIISTTQAVDIINGGIKVNALPEVVTAIVNHRISIESTVSQIQDRMTRTLAPIAKAHNLEFEAWGKKIHLDQTSSKAGKLILDVAWNATIETAPVSPFTTDSAAWRLLAGTIKATWATRPNSKGGKYDEIFMAPLMSTGNTDTKNYWSLTKNIVSLTGRVWCRCWHFREIM
jgi:Gly-Xaa carboxypeptidase